VGDEKLTVNFPKRTISFPMYFHCPYLSGSEILERKKNALQISPWNVYVTMVMSASFENHMHIS